MATTPLDDTDEFDLPRPPLCPKCFNLLRNDPEDETFHCNACGAIITYKELLDHWDQV